MRLLLINNNPAVSKLINLSAEKLGYEIDEISDDNVDLEKSFDITITDSDSVDESSFLLLKESGSLGKVVYIGSRGIEKPEFADYMLYKPFLPTDFVELLKQIGKTIEVMTPTPLPVDDFQEDVIDDFSMNEDGDHNTAIESPELEDYHMEDAKEGLDLDNLDMMASVPNDLLKFDDNTLKIDDDLDFEAHESEDDAVVTDNDDDTHDNALSTYDEQDELDVPSILDHDDINQVKQLLEDEDILQNDEVFEHEDEDEGIQISPVDDRVEDDTKYEDDDVHEDDESLQMLDFESQTTEPEEGEIPAFIDIIDDETEKSSLDDLCEEDFDGIFEEDLSNAKEALHTSIVEDVKKVLGKEELKAALKGFKVNISISIDEL